MTGYDEYKTPKEIKREEFLLMDNVEYLQSLGATVESITESRTAVLDQNGYHVDLTGFNLTLEENELDTFAQLEDK